MDPLDQLASLIVQGYKPLFITGAGLSVASGIAPYRGAKNAIWEEFVYDWATKARFEVNPKEWWNDFWLRTHERNSFLCANPNAGHRAIAWILNHCNSKVITQNIDALHLKSGIPLHKLVEIHGRLGLYRCLNSACRYSTTDSLTEIDFDAEEGTNFEKDNMMLKNPPRCPACNDFVMPQSLLFDEEYESHAFYKAVQGHTWFKEYDIYVFVGTSFSVGITNSALKAAKRWNKLVFNFNLFEETGHHQKINQHIAHVLGPAEQTLPLLVEKIYRKGSKPRLWYYSSFIQEDEE
eukprot:TRINITY_DN3692_c0_g1_i1.p1 TRINITY_DN3692_c0_g1~~TRINITY_DN3692_c0_g1_i1.p1  ORF type:complete len:293 (+),score=66.22 TRINITY_DN3692_c0_g1_i1:96-974(+)